tara:strand:+ start:274 stop:621 length:348 start_codon:yes stop_codon:yes gene_type:complete
MSLGEIVAKNDKIIRDSISNIFTKEKKILERYNLLNKLKASCSDNMKSEIESLIDQYRIFIEYKTQSKKQQLESLYKLLEYLNYLEIKEKELDYTNIFNKINTIKDEYQSYHLVL